MQTFIYDLKHRKTFISKLTAMTVAALALGMAFPFVFALVADKAPILAPVLKVEGAELGGTVILFPAGMLFLTLACVVLEALLLGYENSTLKRVLADDSASVRTDFLYLLLRVSGLMMVFGLVLTLGGLFPAVDTIKREFGYAIMGYSDSIALHFVAMAVLHTFINYWAHRILHSKYLWVIHQVHHSAKHYNVLLPYRHHPVEFIIATLYGAFILGVLGIRPEAVMLWLGVNAVYQSLVHSNYDWKWKWLEAILITPAAHRIHHSTNPIHFNSNLGILSIWDRIFGTYIAPTTGEIIDLGVGQPDQKNYNTDHFFVEIMACFGRWLGLRKTV
jgi:sterol desaturase/sphingolipid hydroxylase (fatty acid hydroxylase superfamily)